MSKRRRKRRTPTLTTDDNGNPIAYVPLSAPSREKTRRYATVDADVYDRLVADGVSDQWNWTTDGRGNNYVTAWFEGRLVTVARLVYEAVGREVVRYRDGDRTNLRLSNLTSEEGFSKHDAVVEGEGEPDPY